MTENGKIELLTYKNLVDFLYDQLTSEISNIEGYIENGQIIKKTYDVKFLFESEESTEPVELNDNRIKNVLKELNYYKKLSSLLLLNNLNQK